MKKLITVLWVILLSACAATTPPPIVDEGNYYADVTHSSQSQNDRIRFLIFHYTALDDTRSLQVLTTGGVSAHYLIPSTPSLKNGKPVIFQLVPEAKRAWHAGSSDWNGRNNLNDTSVGIEIVNLGFTENQQGKTWYPFHQSQVNALVLLAKDIIQRYQISPDNVLAHSDIAPLRKFDPGPLFPWKVLAQQGIGAWPDDMTVNKYLASRNFSDLASVASIQEALAKYGYKIPQTGQLDKETQQVISAFQMHFRPENISGTPDAHTEAIALALVEKYRP